MSSTRDIFIQAAAASLDDCVLLDFTAWRERFMNDADWATAKRTYDLLTPEPMQPFRDRLELKTFFELEIPKSYINCTEDTAQPHGEWGWHPKMSGRLGNVRLVQMPGGHEVMFTNPEGLAQKIVEAGRD